MKAENGLKKCSKCGDVKSIEDFSRDATKIDNLRSQCRACNNAKAKSFYELNKESISKSRIDYKNKDILLHRKKRMEWERSNKDKIKSKYLRRSESMPDFYVANSIASQFKIPYEIIYANKEIIQVKREILKIKRICKTLKN